MKQLVKQVFRFVRDCCDCKLGKRRRRVTWKDEEGDDLEVFIPLSPDKLTPDSSSQSSQESQAKENLRHLLDLHEKEASEAYLVHSNPFHSECLEERCSVATWLAFVVHKLELKPYVLQTALYLLDKVIEVGLFGGPNSTVLALGCLSIACKINNVMLATTSTLASLVDDKQNTSEPIHTVAEAEMLVMGIVDFHLHPPLEEEFVYLLMKLMPKNENIAMHNFALATELVVLSGLRFSACSDGNRASGIETAIAILVLAGVDQLHIPAEALNLVKDWTRIERIQESLSHEFLKYQMGKYSGLSKAWFGAPDSQQVIKNTQQAPEVGKKNYASTT